jgi:hypothetical protein|nr:MAG TPA: hypothetical protein [Caudoviricetes sp.]
MPNQTAKMQFNTFLENDVVDWSLINDNFEKLDNVVLCVESGEKTAAYSGGVTGNATWRYKKYSDGSIELYTKMEFDNIKCNGGASSPYYSGTSKVMFPFRLTAVHDVQMHLASNTIGWVSDITGKSVIDYVMFRVMSTAYESTNIYKQVFINVKGRWK